VPADNTSASARSDGDARAGSEPPVRTPRAGDVVEVVIAELGHGAVGIARHASGLVCLVPHALPGERVTAVVVRRQTTLAHARLVQVLDASPRRVVPPCPFFSRCGGCDVQHLAYADQLASKRDILLRTLTRALGQEVERLVAPMTASPSPLGYRNRATYHVRGLELGFVDHTGREVVAIERCLLVEPAVERVFLTVRGWLAAEGAVLAPVLREVVARGSDTGPEGGGALCVLVVAAETLPPASLARWRTSCFAAALAALGAALAPAGLWLHAKARDAKVTFGATFAHVAGAVRLREQVGPVALELSPASFAQANPALAALLYARAAAWLAPRPDDVVLDLFSGSGALALHLAPHCARVVAVELNAGAVADARASAARNRIDHVDWHVGKCEVVTREQQRRGERMRCVVVNPPRTGLHEDLPRALAALGVERLAYVSCAPPTLARDLVRLRAQGFVIATIEPFDMFAQTHHVEVLVGLVRAEA
jgi:23S rRNA (uracil1939-C5)-methyltransferase